MILTNSYTIYRFVRRFVLITGWLMLCLAAILLSVDPAEAQNNLPNKSPMHPTFKLLDSVGKSVLESGNPVSTMRTCGSCHDTKFIAENNTHAVNTTRTLPTANNVVVDNTQTALPTPEMNCFLCHTGKPNNGARLAALNATQVQWANSATLLDSGLLTQANGKYQWNHEAFDTEEQLKPEYVTIQDPTSENCGSCHGIVHTDAQTPLALTDLTTDQWLTLTTGQIMSPQRLINSGVNFMDKGVLDRSWDIHAERVLNCTNCHYSLNNPVYYKETNTQRPQHIAFDPRRLDLGEYLYRPLHQFAGTGNTSTGSIAISEDNSQRCTTCHSTEPIHNWLPYKDRHTAALACETCHVPKLYAPALESVDWTVINPDGSPQLTYRGISASTTISGKSLITGFAPVLLPRSTGGGTALAPYNLVSVWYWVSNAPAQPISQNELKMAYLDGTTYNAEVLAVFDADKNGTLDDRERFIDSESKTALITKRLQALGLTNPRIVGEVKQYGIHHNVASGEWAIKECSTCHGENSLITQPMRLAGRIPGNVLPTMSGISNGNVQTDTIGQLNFTPAASAPPTNLYVFGHNSVYWIDWLGIMLFFGTLLGVLVHGGLRYLTARHQAQHTTTLEPVYMYSVYERLWHWLQTAVIVGLLFTGIIIHKPDKFGALSFSFIVQVHNILAIILVINAALAAFYHLASGEIRQFLPRPYGFFDQAFAQAKFYLRGIFKGDPHPFQKTPDRKMNPLQQLTYLMILNILLPLQVITGALMWGVQHWSALAAQLGGLAFLAPLHTIVAWLFGSFIVLHVYLTTTGHTPVASIKAMMLGWEDIETHSQPTSKPATKEGLL